MSGQIATPKKATTISTDGCPDSTSYSLRLPVDRGTPTQYWRLLTMLYNENAISATEIKKRGYFYTAEGMMRKGVRCVQYDRLSRQFSLTQRGIDYVEQNSALVARLTVKRPTIELSAIDTPNGKFYVTVKGAEIGFNKIADAREFVKGL